MYSFDVYDTIITRKVIHPQAIFEIMKYKMLQKQEQFNFFMEYILDFENLRVNAEKQARREVEGEVTLKKIYNMLSQNYNISSEMIEKLMKLELQCELENTVVIEENIKKIEELLESGEKVILISDMYLPQDFFKALFDKICPVLNDLTLYISCEIGKTKNSGLLYDYVKQKEKIEYYDWIHEGDNVISDVNIPKIFGIKTVHYSMKIDKIAFERLGNVTNEQGVVSEYMQGMLKNIGDDTNSKSYIIGYSFLGSVLYAYVDWIIKQSVERQIQDLYFIARDGYILKKIADRIIYVNNISVNTYYLYGSRKAWRVKDTQKKEMLLEYLNQEICKENNFALIDTQGTGVSIDCLAKLLGKRITVFYYTLLEKTNDKFIEAYAYSPYSGKGMIETFCRAPHGPTVGYEKIENKVVPVREEMDMDIWNSAGLQEYIQGVLDFSQDFAEINKYLGNVLPINSLAEKILIYCSETPDIQLANFIGDIPHDSNNENEIYRYAPMLSDEEIYQIEMVRTTEPLARFYNGVELEYSYKRLNMSGSEKVEMYHRKFYSDICEKEKNAINVVIYGYGVYGKELHHRLFKAFNVRVIGIIDVNYQRYRHEYVQVSPIETLKELSYDYIVVSLYDKKVSNEIKKMLVAAGVKEERIILGSAFTEKVLEDFSSKNKALGIV